RADRRGREPEQASPPETPWQVGTLPNSPDATACESRWLRRRGSLPRGGRSWHAAWQAALPDARRPLSELHGPAGSLWRLLPGEYRIEELVRRLPHLRREVVTTIGIFDLQTV